jgi:hypothetical protein
MATTAIPDGAACYFCLGEEGDDEGKPLVRDCSCRGNSGFAHLHCLVEFADQKCKHAADGDLPSFREPWYKCTNCKQLFQNQLAIDLSCAFVTFSEATYVHPDGNRWDKMKVLDSLRLNIELLNTFKVLFTDEDDDKKDLSNKLLDMAEQTKKDLKMSTWIHMPEGSNEYQYYKLLCGHYETYAHFQLGCIARSDTSEEGFKVSITHNKKVRAI